MTESSVATAAEESFTAMSDDTPSSGASAAMAGASAARKRAGKPDDAVGIRALQAAGAERLDLLSNIEMEVTAELGRTRMTVRELLSLTPGMVVELDRMAGSPIDLFVNGTLIAHGEVVVIDEEFGIRISEIVGPTTPEAAR